MTLAETATPAAAPPGIVTIRRSTPRLVADIIRNPLTALPTACFNERLVLSRNFGVLRAYICDPALVHEVIVRSADQLEKDTETKRVLGTSLGQGLLTADGPAWRWQRQTLAPAFQHAKLKSLLPAMIAAAERTRDAWLALPPAATIEARQEMMRTTFAIIVETMLSGRESFDAQKFEASVGNSLRSTSWRYALELLRAPSWMPFPGKARAMAGVRYMRASVRASIAARRAAGEGGADLIAMLLAAADPETGRTMTDEEITDNIMTFVLAGHETTALALTWSLSLLSDHPAIADRVATEVEAVTGGGPLAPAHIGDLDYTRQVISEAMRLYPPAALLARRVARDIEIGGVALPADAVLFVPVYAIHRHAAIWPRPDYFDPDRFAPDAVRGRHRYAFMPFGAGPRVCIGNSFAIMEAVAILAVLVRAMRLERDGPAPEPVLRVTLRPQQPVEMRIMPRG